MGLDRAHGSYEISGERADGKKQGRAKTVREDVTDDKWQSHIQGKMGLGIIPINDSSECRFGAIDIDEYEGLDIGAINKKLIDFKFPLWPCQSKSGGVHLYLFTSEWVGADTLQRKLRDMAAALGYGSSEIFPKQTQILAERGDELGLKSWEGTENGSTNKLLTHVIFHPVQKSLNRLIQIDYTLRIQSLTTFTETSSTALSTSNTVSGSTSGSSTGY